MNGEIVHTGVLAASFLLLFASAEAIYFFFKPRAEYTRKLVHFGTGILTLLFPVLLHSVYSVLFLCASFALLLFVSLKFNFLKSINAIGRKSHGSISYPAAVFSVFVFYTLFRNETGQTNFINFYLPILMLAICDPLAALFGGRWPFKKFKVGDGHKSITGTSVFFVSAFILCFSLLYFFAASAAITDKLFFSFLLAFTGTIAEAVSPKGLDNITIPGAASAMLFLIDTIN